MTALIVIIMVVDLHKFCLFFFFKSGTSVLDNLFYETVGKIMASFCIDG